MVKLLAALAVIAALAVPSFAVTVTGAGSPINAQLSVPYPSPTRVCANVALSTRTPTLVLAANSARMSLEVINVSNATLGADTPRPPLILVSTGSTTNLGTAPARANFNQHVGRIIVPQVSGADLSTLNPGGLIERGSNVYTGAIYALAESSGTSGVDVLARVQACEEY